jgi:hypothetical protein
MTTTTPPGMTESPLDAYDVFVGLPATVPQVRHTIEYRLNSGAFSTAGWAPLGRHAAVQVHGHYLPDTVLRDRQSPVRLATDFPIRICIRTTRCWADTLENEATARRVFAVLRDSAWPAVLVRSLREVIEIARFR